MAVHSPRKLTLLQVCRQGDLSAFPEQVGRVGEATRPINRLLPLTIRFSILSDV
jgi:hypothetical protein